MADEKPKADEKPSSTNASEGTNVPEGQSPPPSTLEQLKTLREAVGLQTQALEGKTSLGDDVSIESAILAYHSLGLIGAEIARSLRAQNVKQVVLLNLPDLTGFHDLRWIRTRTEAIRKMFEAVKPPTQEAAAAAVAAIGTVAMVATTLIDLFSLFRVDVDVKSADLTLEEEALISELARHLKPESKLFYPKVLPFDLASPGVGAFGNSALKQALEELHKAQQEAEGRAAADDKDLVAAKEAFQSLREDLFKVDEAGTSLLARLLRAELLASRLEGNEGHLLHLKITKAGGSQKTDHSRLKAKDSISYSGGAVVTYILFASDGSIASSQTLYLHSGFREFARGDDDEFPLSNF